MTDEQWCGREEAETWELGLSVMPYNARMRNARKAMNLSQVDLALVVGVPGQTIQRIETLRQMPELDLAQEIADALQEDVARLFPAWTARLHQRFARNIAVLITDADVLPEYAARRELGEKLHVALQTLSKREARTLELRFGLDGGPSRTLEEVGREFGVSRERVRQFEAKAMRKLRHPWRAKQLRDFLPVDGYSDLIRHEREDREKAEAEAKEKAKQKAEE